MKDNDKKILEKLVALYGVDKVRKELVRCGSELNKEGVIVWDGMNGQIEPVPKSGWILDVTWAVAEQSYEILYPTESQARNALETLALQYGKAIREEEYYPIVDLTAYNCSDSYARIYPSEQHRYNKI